MHHVKLMLSSAPVFSAARSRSWATFCCYCCSACRFVIIFPVAVIVLLVAATTTKLPLARKLVLFPITGVALSWPSLSLSLSLAVLFCHLFRVRGLLFATLLSHKYRYVGPIHCKLEKNSISSSKSKNSICNNKVVY